MFVYLWRAARYIVLAALFAFAIASPARSDLKFSEEALPNGTKFILISGHFEPADDFTPLFNLIASHKPEFITFNSPGGSIVKAIMLGRILRLYGLETTQIRPLQCDSACTLAFLGGARRGAGAGALGIHMSSIRKDGTRDPDQEGMDLQKLTSAMLAYVREMGVSSELIELALRTDPTDMRHLTLKEMREWKVTNVDGNDNQQPRAEKPLPPVLRPQPQLPSSPSPSAEAVHNCDRLAANPYDVQKLKRAPGVDYDTLLRNRKEAVIQCEIAIGQFPTEKRFRYQLARSIELDDSKTAATVYMSLINQKYLAAYDNLGWMYLTGRYGGKVNKGAAAKLFREGAGLGDPDSMHSLGVMLWDENPHEAVSWFKRAVSAGHLQAKISMQKLEDQIRQNQSLSQNPQ